MQCVFAVIEDIANFRQHEMPAVEPRDEAITTASERSCFVFARELDAELCLASDIELRRGVHVPELGRFPQDVVGLSESVDGKRQDKNDDSVHWQVRLTCWVGK